MRLADEFLQQIPNHSVTLFDKNFWSADLLLSLATGGKNPPALADTSPQGTGQRRGRSLRQWG